MDTTERLSRESAPATRLLGELEHLFFRSFFRLLLTFVAVAEWTCIAWVLHQAGVHLPTLVHPLAIGAFFLLNRRIAWRRSGESPARNNFFSCATGAYAAVAFISVFCTLFLMLAGLVYLGVTLTVGGGQVFAALYPRLVDGGLAATATLLLFGYTFGSRELHVSELKVPVAGLPPALDGIRIVHISDLHIGDHLDLDGLRSHVEHVNRLDADLICLTGDIVDRAETCAAAFPVLAGLRARYGVLVTLGNHDVHAGAEAVTRALRELTPFDVLRDARRTIVVGDARLQCLGLDDLGRDWARGVREHPALPGLAASVPAGDPMIVLSHRPECFAQAARLGSALMLSGHTHGGQLALPASRGRRARNLAEFISDFDRGRYTIGESTLYVNRGLGFTGQKIRLFTPREIAVIELVASR